MATSELQYVLEHNDAGWIVRCESTLYGPYPNFQDALEGAVDEAAEAGDVGSTASFSCRLETTCSR